MSTGTAAPTIDVTAANEQLATLSAEQRLAWAHETFGMQAALLSSLQKTASVLMHMIYRQQLPLEVLFVDTGYHFHQTLRLRDEFMLKYQLQFVTLYPDQTPEEQEKQFSQKLYLSVDGQPECCRLRKEVPFLNYVRERGIKLVMNGRRSTEGGKRSQAKVLEIDPRIDGFVLHPILDWTDALVQDYINEHQPPIHPLHAQRFPSIGCACCTTPVEPWEEERAGRWRHLRSDDQQGPKYCGINFSDGSGI